MQAELSPPQVAIPALRIVSFPSMKRLPVGVQVRFEVQTLDGEPLPEGLLFNWRCVNDPSAGYSFQSSRVQGPRGSAWDNASWTLAGRHTIQLTVKNPETGEIKRIQFDQTVDYAANLVAHELTETLDEASITPFQYLLQTKRYRDVLEKIAKSYPPSDAHKEEHQSRMGEIENQVSRLSDLMQGLDTSEGYVVPALHTDEETGTRTPLRLWLCYLGFDNTFSLARGRRYRWRLIDWTNPAYRNATGSYESTGESHEEAISNALSAWNSGNRYPKGHLHYEVDIPHRSVTLNEGFDTNGRNFWDSISTWLGYTALGLVAAGLMFIPVAGQGAAVTLLLSASMVTSTGSAVINIATRHADGFGDGREDLFDGLTIAGNLFGAGTIATTWRMGATLTSTSRLGTGMTQATLIGQAGTDGLQGILLGAEYLDEYQDIMESPDLSPEQRLNRMLELMRSAAVVGSLTYLSVHSTASDLRQMGRPGGPPDLLSVESRIDLDAPLPPASTPVVSGQNVQTTVAYQGRQPANQTPGPALASGALARVSRSFKNPRNFDEARGFLRDARERLQAGGSPLKYSDDELRELASMAEQLSDNFVVRFMPKSYLYEGGDLTKPYLSGRLGNITNGEVQHWSTTFDQLVDSDTHPDMVRRSIGVERYDAKREYVLILIDRQRYQALGTETLVPTFRNMADLAIRKMDPNPDDMRLIREVMTPEYRATYRNLRGEADSRGIDLGKSKQQRNFLTAKFGSDMEQHKLFSIRYQLERRYGMNAQFEGIGVTRSLHDTPAQQYGALETFTVESQPQQLRNLKNNNVIDIVELQAF